MCGHVFSFFHHRRLPGALLADICRKQLTVVVELAPRAPEVQASPSKNFFLNNAVTIASVSADGPAFLFNDCDAPLAGFATGAKPLDFPASDIFRNPSSWSSCAGVRSQENILIPITSAYLILPEVPFFSKSC